MLIPKPGGGERPLGIPAIWDRVVQTAVVLFLEPILEADFEDNVYAYRPQRSAHDALAEVQERLYGGQRHVVDGEAGATHALCLLRDELDLAMAGAAG